MIRRLPRRQFSASLIGIAGAAMLAPSYEADAAPPKSSEPKVPTKPLPPVTVTVMPEAFESRHADLGGVLDLANGVIWGYEPYASLVNGSSSFRAGLVNQDYLGLLAYRQSIAPTPEEADAFAHALDVASERIWRWPTVFEARAAVEKGLFTFGDGGCNLYYGAPFQLGVSYGTGGLRWTSSESREGPNGLVHQFSAADGGTLLGGKTSSIWGIVVAKL